MSMLRLLSGTANLPLILAYQLKGLAPFCCLYMEGVDAAVFDLSQACLISLTLVKRQVTVCFTLSERCFPSVEFFALYFASVAVLHNPEEIKTSLPLGLKCW